MKSIRNLLRQSAIIYSLIAILIAPTFADQNTIVYPTSGPLTMSALMVDINAGQKSIATNYSGATPPAVCASAACLYQFWLDTSTSPHVLRMNDGTSWVPIGSLDISAHVFTISTSLPPSVISGATSSIVDTNRGALLDYTNSSAAVSLPQAGAGSPAQFISGWWAILKNGGTGSVTITPTTSTIDGGSSLVLTPGQSVVVVSDGTNYQTSRGLGLPTSSSLGGVYALSATSHIFLTGLGVNGILTTAQPACGDLSNSTVLCSTAPGTGVATALGVNIGTAGAFVVNGGALGTPSSGNLANETGLPISTGVSGLGTGIATALGVNVGTAGSPVVNGGALGTPSSGSLANATGLPLSTGVTGILPAANGGAGAVNGALKGNGSGAVSQAGCADLSDGGNGGCAMAYAQGTWTCAIAGSSTPGTGQTYSAQVCSYEHIGRLVILHFSIFSSSIGTASGNLQITGLPFAAVNNTNDNGNCTINTYAVSSLAALNYGMGGVISPGNSYISVQSNGITASNNVTVAQYGATGAVVGVCMYKSS